MVVIRQFQGRKAKRFEYPYLDAVPAEVLTTDDDAKSPVALGADNTTASYVDIKVYGDNQWGQTFNTNELGVTTDSFITETTTGDEIIGAAWRAQTFTAGSSYTIGKVRLMLAKNGAATAGTVTASIRATAGGLPTGGDLCSGSLNGNLFNDFSPMAWYWFYLGAGTPLTSGTVYAIVIRAPAASVAIRHRYNNANAYAGGQKANSADSGATWAANAANDIIFQTSRPETSISKVTIYGKKVGNPSALLMNVYATSAGLPTGASLKSGTSSTLIETLAENEITLSSALTGLTGNTVYAIMFSQSGTSASDYYVLMFGKDSFGESIVKSTNGGSSYSALANVNLYSKIYKNTEAAYETINTEMYTIFTTQKIAQTFLGIVSTCRTIYLKLRKHGTFASAVTVELRDTSETGTLRNTTTIAAADIPTDWALIPAVFSATYTLAASGYCIVAYPSVSTGDSANCVEFAQTSSSTYATYNMSHYISAWTQYTNFDLIFGVAMLQTQNHIAQEDVTGGGKYDVYAAVWIFQTLKVTTKTNVRIVQFKGYKTGAPADSLYCMLEKMDTSTAKPDGTALYTGSIAAASVGGSPGGWYSITISYPLEMNTYYAIVFKSPGSAAAANGYQIYYSNANPYANGNVGTSADSGVTWTAVAANDLAFRITVPTEQKIFDETIDCADTDLISALANIHFGMDGTLKSYDGNYVTLRVTFDDVEQTDCGAQINGTTAYFTVELISELKEISQASVSVEMYGAGDGIITELVYCRYRYFDNDAPTAANFGCSEMIMVAYKLPVGSYFYLNDDSDQMYYNPLGASRDKVEDFGAYQREVNVRKITFASGKATIVLLGR